MRLGVHEKNMMTFFAKCASWHSVAVYDGSWARAKRLAKRGLLEVSRAGCNARLSKPLRDINRWIGRCLDRLPDGGQFGWDRHTLAITNPNLLSALDRLEKAFDDYVRSH